MQQAKDTSSKGWRQQVASKFFTGSNCEIVKTVLENKFNDGDYKSEKDTIDNSQTKVM